MVLEQGQRAVQSGNVLEHFVESLMESLRVHVCDAENGANASGDLLEAVRLIKNAPYTNIYGSRGKSEFVLEGRSTGRSVRIECRSQDVSGSVDEKFPFLFLNMRNCTGDSDVIFLLSGNGARVQAISWLKRQCVDRNVYQGRRKNMSVMRMDDFRKWAIDFVHQERV